VAVRDARRGVTDPYADGWAAGYAAALADIAARHAELHQAWRPIGRRLHAQRVAAQVALYERCAAQLAQRMGRPAGYTYTGGPVPWDNHDPTTHTTPHADPDPSRPATPDASRSTTAPHDASTADTSQPATSHASAQARGDASRSPADTTAGQTRAANATPASVARAHRGQAHQAPATGGRR
jgi:hypothetical protein